MYYYVHSSDSRILFYNDMQFRVQRQVFIAVCATSRNLPFTAKNRDKCKILNKPRNIAKYQSFCEKSRFYLFLKSYLSIFRIFSNSLNWNSTRMTRLVPE